MVSDVVLTQADLTTQRIKKDTIGLGSYRFDGHPDALVAGPDSTLCYEGLISAPITGRYDIPYSILVPKSSEIRNLLDPVTVSASHVAFASIRMEPQYMIMGQAAGSAAALASKSGADVQRVDTATLHAALRANGVIFRPPQLLRAQSLPVRNGHPWPDHAIAGRPVVGDPARQPPADAIDHRRRIDLGAAGRGRWTRRFPSRRVRHCGTRPGATTTVRLMARATAASRCWSTRAKKLKVVRELSCAVAAVQVLRADDFQTRIDRQVELTLTAALRRNRRPSKSPLIRSDDAAGCGVNQAARRQFRCR